MSAPKLKRANKLIRVATCKKIDKLKEEIKELNNQRQKFASDRSEGAKEQRKIIDGKIMMLNSQIATLLKVQKDQAASA